jgi:hypothetical protein
MSDPRGIAYLVRNNPSALDRLLIAAGAHGDLRLAADQAGVDRGDAEALLVHGDEADADIAEASLALYAAMTQGRANQNTYAKQVFLAHLSMRGILTEAVAAQPWHPRKWFYEERGKDPDFDAAWAEALAEAADNLHAEAWRRAHDGVNKPLVWQGEISKDASGKPITIKEYSDSLLAMLLKRHDPSFRDSLSVEQRTTIESGAGTLAHALANLTDAEVAVLVKLTKAPGALPMSEKEAGECDGSGDSDSDS